MDKYLAFRAEPQGLIPACTSVQIKIKYHLLDCRSAVDVLSSQIDVTTKNRDVRSNGDVLSNLNLTKPLVTVTSI